MRSRATVAGVIVGVVVATSACAYRNVIYNADRLYLRAEASRRAGDDAVARDLYGQVVAKTGEAYRARPQSAWATEALFLLGRSHLRLGSAAAAEAALETALQRADSALAGPIRVYLAAARGDRGKGGLEVLEEAFASGLEGSSLAEAHYVRGRWLLARGFASQGLWDLDRAAATDRGLRLEAALAALTWSLEADDQPTARRALDRLLGYPEAAERLPAIVAALHEAETRWGAAAAADLVAETGPGRWTRDARARLVLERARLLHATGDTATAGAEARAIASTLGDAAAEARIQLARWHLDRTQDIADAYAVRGILLPAGAHPGVSEIMGAVDQLETLTDIGLGEPLGWFAAAEVARDRLGADYLARGLFLAYVDGAPQEPWAAKALLAALSVSDSEEDRAWLRGRLEAHAGNPYVLAAAGGPSAGFESLEEELHARLRALITR